MARVGPKLTTLHERVAAAKSGNKEVASALNEEVQTISGQLLLILSKLGDRPESFNGASAFEVLDELGSKHKVIAKDVLRIDELVHRLNQGNAKLTITLEDLATLVQINKRNGGITMIDLTESRDSILNQVREAIQPFIKLVGRVSSSKEDPGGLLVKRIIDLERTVVALQSSKADASSMPKTTTWREPPASTPSLSWSLGTDVSATITPGASGIPGGGQDIREMDLKVRGLEWRIADLEAQVGGSWIVVAGSEFRSLADAGA
jgi:hypothetical protein